MNEIVTKQRMKFTDGGKLHGLTIGLILLLNECGGLYYEEIAEAKPEESHPSSIPMILWRLESKYRLVEKNDFGQYVLTALAVEHYAQSLTRRSLNVPRSTTRFKNLRPTTTLRIGEKEPSPILPERNIEQDTDKEENIEHNTSITLVQHLHNTSTPDQSKTSIEENSSDPVEEFSWRSSGAEEVRKRRKSVTCPYLSCSDYKILPTTLSKFALSCSIEETLVARSFIRHYQSTRSREIIFQKPEDLRAEMGIDDHDAFRIALFNLRKLGKIYRGWDTDTGYAKIGISKDFFLQLHQDWHNELLELTPGEREQCLKMVGTIQ